MCYYNGIKVSKLEYIELMQLEKDIKKYILKDKPLVNGFEYGDYPIIKPVNEGRDFEICFAHWEFFPNSLKRLEDLDAFRDKYTTMNAKGENILSSPWYGDAARNRRCLVLSSGFYEWRAYKPDGAKKPVKYPYYIHVKGQECFYMAGIWNPWLDHGVEATGELIDSFAIVTTAANSLMEQVHNSKMRMPTILPKELAEEWIQPGLTEERIRELATYQYPSTEMEAYTINKDFRILEDPTEPFNYAELPALVS